MDALFQKQAELLDGGIPFVMVTLVDAAGSTPQEVGAKILVTDAGLIAGTVGGGKVEARALDIAREMLAETSASAGAKGASTDGGGDAATRFVDWSLQKDVGMTCGGRVKLYFERFNRPRWQIAVFGAGHVARALIRILIDLDCRVRCFDPRPEWLAELPESPKLDRVQSDEPAREVAGLAPETFLCLMTKGHTTDLPVLVEALRRPAPFPYVGVIGSKSKRAVLERELESAGIDAERRASFFCPIGLPLGDDRPEEIAISVSAQLVQERDRVTA